VPDRDTVRVDQLGRDSRRTVGLPGCLVDRADQVSQPGVSDRSRRGCSVAPLVETGTRHPELEAGAFDSDSFIGQLGDELEPVFWGHHLLDRSSGLAQDLVLFLQLADTPMSFGELSRLRRARADLQAAVDQIPRLPPIQARLRDPERRGDVTDVRPDAIRSRARRRNSGG
jgi:hypothetical protein